MSASTILNSNGFDQHTDGLEVASRFKDLVVGKTGLSMIYQPLLAD
jgi:hypothetical protein